ncbi:MAG TPA: ATP synthase F0 subunit C [Terriglobia bacterium]|nr:ATP synthase F0 subunit C [Terriglobia bacterium]
MKRYLWILLTAVSALLLAAPAFAQGTGTTTSGAVDTHWIWIASGFSMAIASAGCGYAQSVATAAACEGLGRNPGARASIQFALILGLVLIESMALYTFAIIYLKVK